MVIMKAYWKCLCDQGTATDYKKGCPIHDPALKVANYTDYTVLQQRVKELEAELRKWKTPHDDADLDFMRQQAKGGDLAAKQAYINALAHHNKHLRYENQLLKVQIKQAKEMYPFLRDEEE